MPSGSPNTNMNAARPLLVRFAAFGDAVLLTPLIRQLQARCGAAVDVLSSGPWTQPLLAGQPGVGDVFTVRSRRTPYWLSLDQQRAVRWLRTRPSGPVWFCDRDAVGRSLLTRAGIDDTGIVDADDCPLLPAEHSVEHWLRFAAHTPPAWQQRLRPSPAAVLQGCELLVTQAQRESLQRWLHARQLDGRPLLLVQAGNKRTMRRGSRRRATNTKYWPEANWAAVIRGMRASHPQHAILLLGASRESAFNRDIIRLSAVTDVHDIADDLPIPRLLALLQRADSLLTVDSGPAHAAAAVGCPLVDLFGRASVDLYRPRGVTDAQVICLTASVDGQPDMLGIRVDTVLDAWRRLRPRGQFLTDTIDNMRSTDHA